MNKGYGFFIAMAVLIVIGGGFAYMVQNTQGTMPAVSETGESCDVLPVGGG